MTAPSYTEGSPGVLEFSLDAENEFVLRAGLPPSEDAPTDVGVFQLRHDKTDLHGPAVLALAGHSESVSCIDWCGESNTCFTGSFDSTVCIHTLFKVT